MQIPKAGPKRCRRWPSRWRRTGADLRSRPTAESRSQSVVFHRAVWQLGRGRHWKRRGMIRSMAVLLFLAPAGLAVAQTPAEMFQRICVTAIVDGDYESASSAASSLGLRETAARADEGGMGGSVTYAGRGYDISIWSGPWGEGCSVETPAGVTVAALEGAIGPSLSRWTQGAPVGGRRLWTRTMPASQPYGPTSFAVSIGTSQNGRPIVEVQGQATD